jgi:hypothetical protein
MEKVNQRESMSVQIKAIEVQMTELRARQAG